MKIAVWFAIWLCSIAGIFYVAYSKPVRAQGSGGALVVATCGTLSPAYAVGATRRLTVNTIGQVCQ